MKKERLLWIDNIRGLAALLVILSHTPDTVSYQKALLSLFMIPSFFFVSGYLTKYDGRHMCYYLYNRIIKLLLVYIAYGLLLPFLSLTGIRMIIDQPKLIIDKVVFALSEIFLGKCFWFVACLIIVNIIFMLLKSVAKENDICLIITSTVIAITGLMISEQTVDVMNYWSADTALVCQWFFVLGHLLNRYEKKEWYASLMPKAVISGMIYLSIVLFVGINYNFSLVTIVVAVNQWGKSWITIPIIIVGLISALFSSRLSHHLRLLSYFGANSLLYFAFGSHGMSVMNKLFVLLYEHTQLSIFSNRAIINPIIAFGGAVILIPLCWIINKFIPFLNGHYKLPILKSLNGDHR